MKTLLVYLLLLGAAVSYAAGGGVHGRVYGQDERGENLGPLAGARIELKGDTGGAGASATTNEFGYYQIATLAPGPYRYKVTAPGYKVEDEQRGFAMPQDTREFVHDFLLSKEAKPGTPGPAQTNLVQPAVHGRVYGQDEKGEPLGPLPGAKVELLSGPGGKVLATATANSPGGYYEIKNLPPADYAYRVSAAGFTTEDAGRGFTVPKATLEYVHDFLLSKPPPKRFNCDVPILVIKRISSSPDGRKSDNDTRLPVPNARIVLQPTTNQQTPLNQPFVTDARGEHTAAGLPEGSFTVAIDAPECEPFTGVLKVVCDNKNNDQVIFELQPCNELLHSYVRAILNEGWGPSAQARGASDRGYQRALKAGGAKDCRVSYALALAQLSAGNYEQGQASLASAISQKSDDPAWDRACETRLWMLLSQHQPAQAVKEIRSLVTNHYATRPATPASKDTARLCGVAVGLMKGPWKDMISPGDAALLESDALSSLKGELQTACNNGRDQVAAEHGKIKNALDDALSRLLADVTAKQNAEIAQLTERQTAISATVTALDKELQGLQDTVNQCNERFRIQILGFTQQREALVPQMTTLNGRLQQISACMAQDQQNYRTALAAQQQQQQQMQQQQMQLQQQEILRRQQEEMIRRQQQQQQQQEMMRRQQQQTPTPPTVQFRQQSPSKIYQPDLRQVQSQTQPGVQQGGTTFQPGMRGGGGTNTQAIQLEIQQHQAEIQQIQTQMGVLQRQDAQFVAQITNLQAQYAACTGNAQGTLTAKLRDRERLAKEFEDLDRKRTAPFDPTTFTTPEIDRLKKEDLTVKTYGDLPLDNRREELLDQFDCGAAKDPQRPTGRGQGATPTTIHEPDFPKNALLRTSSAMPLKTAAPSQSQSTPALPSMATMSPAPAVGSLSTPPAAFPTRPPATTPPQTKEQVPLPEFTPSGNAVPPPVPTTNVNGNEGVQMPSRATPPAARPAAAVGDKAEIIVSNHFTGTVRLFGISPGADNEQFVRSLQTGEESMIPAAVGQTFIIRAAIGGQELQRHRISKKLEVLKIGTPR